MDLGILKENRLEMRELTTQTMIGKVRE